MENFNEIKSQSQGLFSFKNEQERVDFEATMMSLRIISDLEAFMEKNGIKKNKLAEILGVDKSFITQVFKGNKLLNFRLLFRLQEALGVKFSTSVHPAPKPVKAETSQEESATDYIFVPQTLNYSGLRKIFEKEKNYARKTRQSNSGYQYL